MMLILSILGCPVGEGTAELEFDSGYAAGCTQAETEGYDEGYADGLACEPKADAKCGMSHYADGWGQGYEGCYGDAFDEGHAAGWVDGGCP